MQHNIAQTDALVKSFVSNFDTVKSRLSLLDYAEQTGIELTELTLSNNTVVYKGKCPLHEEKIGEAFTVNPVTNKWFCNGTCQLRRGEDVIQLHALRFDLTAKQAADELLAWIRGVGSLTTFPVLAYKQGQGTPERGLLTPHHKARESQPAWEPWEEEFIPSTIEGNAGNLEVCTSYGSNT
jgi:hypothetical protein